MVVGNLSKRVELAGEIEKAILPDGFNIYFVFFKNNTAQKSYMNGFVG
jgi:hypothetical protein